MQLIVTVWNPQFGADYSLAISEEGDTLPLTQINRDCKSIDSLSDDGTNRRFRTTCYEIVGVSIPIEYLKEKADMGLTLNLYGEKRNDIFYVSSAYATGFLTKLESHL